MQFINKIGFSVCHQLPERTLLFGKIYMPVCSRCFGIYIGFLFTIIFLFSVFRKKESDLPPLYIIIIIILMILSAIIDGLLSYFEVYTTNNIIRLITGYMFGSGIAIILYPIFIYQYYRNFQRKKIFYHYKYFIYFLILSIIMIFIIILFSSIFLSSSLLKIHLNILNILGTLFYYLSGFAVIFTFFFTNLTLFLLIPFFSQKALKFFSVNLIMPSIIALAATFIEIFISYLFHFSLL